MHLLIYRSLSNVYDNGSIYDAKVLDLTDADIIAKFQKGVKNVACVSLAINYPTVASGNTNINF
jgi:large subunit ribosomal protein LP0